MIVSPLFPRRRWIALCAMLSLVGVAAPAVAQVSPTVESAINRARGHMNSGDGTTARTILDSLVAHAPRASDDLAEVLYWRAAMSDQVADAELDWKRLVIDVPLSPRAPDALLRLGELEILRGRPAAARTYYERIARDFSDSPQQAKAMLWTARSYFEERDVTRACATVAALRAGGPLEGEQQLQSNEMQSRCTDAASRAAAANSPVPSSVPSSSSAATPATNTASGSGMFSVQLAAYDTKAQATAAVKRFVARGVNARVDGTRKPFRVRVGRYETRETATSVLERLKKLGHKGFVVELDQ